MRLRYLLVMLVLALSACSGATPSGTESYLQGLRQSEEASRPDLGRLPSYRIEVTVDPEKSSLSGSAAIRYVNDAPAELREVYLRLYPNMDMYDGDLSVERALVDGREVPFVIGGKGVDLKVPLPRTLPTGRSALIEIDFSLTYREAEGDYAFFGAKDGVIVLPDFHPILAALIDGEWRLDTSPGFGDAVFAPLALHQMDVTVPTGYVAMSGGTATEAKRSETTVTYHLVAGFSRGASLVVAQGYERQELAVGDITLVSYAPEAERTASRAALTHAAAALSYLEDSLGGYPLSVLAFISVPLARPASSSDGAVLLSSALYSERLADLEASVVRGVARHWWGLRVANDPIRDPWIDESLSLYCASLYLRQTHGSGYKAAVEQQWRAAYDEAVSSNLDGPLSQPLAAYGNSARYEWLVECKGPLFWSAGEDMLGESGLLTLLRRLQDDYSYGEVDTAGLADTLTCLVGPPGTALAESWILGGGQ